MFYRLVALNLVDEIGRSNWTLHLPSTIGRSPEHEVAINHDSISRTHCRLTLNAEGALAIRDLNSMNGIYVDDNKITRGTLKPGDILQVGAVSFRVEYVTEPGRDEPASEPETYDLSTTVPLKFNAKQIQHLKSTTSASSSSEPPPAKKWWKFW